MQTLKICVVIMAMNSHVKNSNSKKSLAYINSDRLLGMEVLNNIFIVYHLFGISNLKSLSLLRFFFSLVFLYYICPRHSS